MFGREAELGPGHEKGDVRHLHQAEDDCNRRLLCPLLVLPLPQAQVYNAKEWRIYAQTPNCHQGSSLFEGILSEQEWNSCLYWWKVMMVVNLL